MPRTRQQLEQAAADAEAWLDQLNPDDPTVTVEDPAALRGIAHAMTDVATAEQKLTDAVGRARADGHSWGRIALILGMSRQATQKRYDLPAEAR